MKLRDDKAPGDRATVQSVERSLDILEALAAAGSEVGIADMSGRVGLHISTVHRLLATLVVRGYVRQNSQTGRYSLGSQALQLGRAFHDRSDIRTEARPFLQLLMEGSGETANLVMLDGNEAVYMDQVPSPRLVRMFAGVGRRVPLHSTGSGKAMLSCLPPEERARIVAEKGLSPSTPHTITTAAALEDELIKVGRQGFAVDDEEQEEGVRCIAAPVRDSTRRVVAAMSLSGPSTRMTPERIQSLSGLLKTVCVQLSAALGYREE